MSSGTDLRASYAFCDAVARREAKNFYQSFRLLPEPRRLSMSALYAFMRRTDDLADEPGDPAAKVGALRDWRRDVDRALSDGGDTWEGFAALRDTVRRHEIAPRLLHEVIDGVEMDLTPRDFATFAELRAYCYRVASAVGLCCLSIWGYASDGGRAETLAEACGIALQLTNILRDVGEDARNGRVYLPTEDLDRFGVDRSDLVSGSISPASRKLFAFEAERAARFYAEAEPLRSLVDPVGRPVLATIVGVYRGLLGEIVRRDYPVVSTRVSLPGWRKAAIALGAIPTRFGRKIPQLSGPGS